MIITKFAPPFKEIQITEKELELEGCIININFNNTTLDMITFLATDNTIYRILAIKENQELQLLCYHYLNKQCHLKIQEYQSSIKKRYKLLWIK